jgi:hypothetical protein
LPNSWPNPVSRDDAQIFNDRLRDQKAIHRIPVMERQIGGNMCVLHGDRHPGETVRSHHRRHVGRYPCAPGLFP